MKFNESAIRGFVNERLPLPSTVSLVGFVPDKAKLFVTL